MSRCSTDAHIGIEPHEISPELNILLVCRIEIALGKAGVMNGIQYVGFAHSIGANEAIDLSRKG